MDLSAEERSTLRARYEAALHGLQSGVAFMMGHGGAKSCEPKHLRVGVNAAMSDQGSLAKLLIDKGLLTEREYYTAMAEGMERELASYESSVQAVTGNKNIRLR